MNSNEVAISRFAVFAGGVILFLLFELFISYRENSVSKPKRWIINFSITVINTAVLSLLFSGKIMDVTTLVSGSRIGFLNYLELPYLIKLVLFIGFMDFMLYVWHLLNHEMPLLWRFHRVHHSDLNMDVSSATRFHIGELMISAVIKISLIYFSGAGFFEVALFESMIVLAAQFEHSSMRVPPLFEKFFIILFVPPSMHRVHHSVVIKERNSNYGTIFSLWDRIFGTLVMDVDQKRIRIGVGAYQKEEELGFINLMLMPFRNPVK